MVAAVEIITDPNEALSVAEFSLILEQGDILGRLRFPPGIARSAVREFIDAYTEHPSIALVIVKQHCIGDKDKTTAWSSLIFLADLKLHQMLYSGCRESNLRAVRAKTNELMNMLIQLESAGTTHNDAVDEETAKTAQTASSENETPAPSEEPEATTPKATVEQLKQLTVKQLRELAIKHGINIRVKRRSEAEEKLIPELIEVVTVEEIA